MKKVFGFLFLSAVIVIAGCSTTSPGMNRQQIVKNTPASLPLKVIIGEKGRDIESVGTAEKVSYKDLVLMFGVSSIGVAQLAKNETAIAAIRGRFAAGQAFEEAGKQMCTPDPAVSIVKLELVRFKHFGSSRKPGYTGVSGLMQFTAELPDSHRVTLSSYSFAWETKGLFFASQERDVLREIMENALAHWGQQVVDPSSTSGQIADFPGPKSGEFSVGDADYVYDIFKSFP